jgi:hypothetical protein
MTSTTVQVEDPKTKGRSRISNGALMDRAVDGRSGWARRLRDLIGLHLSDLGGEDMASEAERSIVRRVATLTVELERMETAFALAGEAQPEQLELYQRVASTMRRLLEAIGIKRVPRNVTPTLEQYLANRKAPVE